MRTKWLSAGLVLCCCALGAAGPVMAADTAAATASTQTSQQTTTMDKVTVTATRTDVDPALSPVDGFTVYREDIESQPNYYMANFGEFIRDLPGVHVAQYYPWGPPWVHLRGTGHFLQRTVYLIDGVPAHHFLSAGINPNDIDRVDVVLGPSSALYGASAAGGAVNIITRGGQAGQGADLRFAYGSNNTFRPYASVGDAKGNFNYYFSYSADISDGYQMKPIDGMVDLFQRGKTQYVRQASVEDNRYEYHWLTGKVGWNNHRGTSLTMAVNYQNRYLYGGQPNYLINDHGDTLVSSLHFATDLGSIGRLSAPPGISSRASRTRRPPAPSTWAAGWWWTPPSPTTPNGTAGAYPWNCRPTSTWASTTCSPPACPWPRRLKTTTPTREPPAGGPTGMNSPLTCWPSTCRTRPFSSTTG